MITITNPDHVELIKKALEQYRNGLDRDLTQAEETQVRLSSEFPESQMAKSNSAIITGFKGMLSNTTTLINSCTTVLERHNNKQKSET